MPRRVLVIGLDGVSFKTIIQGFESNQLPVMSSLVKDGYMTQMQSHYIPQTPESIGCFVTGKNPGETGLFGWYRYPNGTPRLVTSEDWTAPFWDYLGRRTVIIGLPLTYPAKPINGALVGSAHFSPSLRHFTYPENLAEIAKEYGYVPPENGFQAASDVLRATGRSLLAEERLASHLLSSAPWELAIVYFQQTDIISHAVGMVSSAVSEQYFRTLIVELVLRQIDEWLGGLLRLLESNVDAILFSDHGFGPYEYAVNLSALLEEIGLSVPRKDEERFSLFGEDQPDVSRTGLFVSDHLNRAGLRIVGCMKDDANFEQRAKCKLEEALSTLKDSNGSSLVAGIRTCEQLYHGQKLDEAPDFFVEFDRSAMESKDFDTSCIKKRSFGHEVEGFMLGHVCDSNRPSGIFAEVSYRTYDLAATVLALFGMSIPDDFDGRPFDAVSKTRGLLERAVHTEERSERRGLTKEEEKRIIERLKQLGYV